MIQSETDAGAWGAYPQRRLFDRVLTTVLFVCVD